MVAKSRKKYFTSQYARHLGQCDLFFFHLLTNLAEKCNNHKMESRARLVCETLRGDYVEITRTAIEAIQGRINYHARRVAPMTSNRVEPDQSNETWTHDAIQDLAALEHALFPHLDLRYDYSGRDAMNMIVSDYDHSELNSHLGILIAVEVIALRFVLANYAVKFGQSVGAADIRNYFREVLSRVEKKIDERPVPAYHGAIDHARDTARGMKILLHYSMSSHVPSEESVIDSSVDVCEFLPAMIVAFRMPKIFPGTHELLAKCPPGHATPDNFRTIFGRLGETERTKIRETIRRKIYAVAEATKHHYRTVRRMAGNDLWKAVLDNLKEFERTFVSRCPQHYDLFHNSTDNLSAEEIIAKFRSVEIDPTWEIQIAVGLLACRRILIDHVNDTGPGAATDAILEYFKEAYDSNGQRLRRFFYALKLERGATVPIDERPFSFLSEMEAIFGTVASGAERAAIPHKRTSRFNRLDRPEREKIKSVVNGKIDASLDEFSLKATEDATAWVEKTLANLARLEEDFAPDSVRYFDLSHGRYDYNDEEIIVKYGIVSGENVAAQTAHNDSAITVARNIAVHRQLLLDYCAGKTPDRANVSSIYKYFSVRCNRAWDIVGHVSNVRTPEYKAAVEANATAHFLMSIVENIHKDKSKSVRAAYDESLDNIMFLNEMETLHTITVQRSADRIRSLNLESSTADGRGSPRHSRQSAAPPPTHRPIVYGNGEAYSNAAALVKKYSLVNDVEKKFENNPYKILNCLDDMSDSFVPYHMRLVKLSAHFKLPDREILLRYDFHEDAETDEIVRLDPREALRIAVDIVTCHIFLLKFAKAHPNDERTGEIVRWFNEECRRLSQIYGRVGRLGGMETSKVMALTDTIATMEKMCEFLGSARPADDGEVEKFIAETNCVYRFILELHRIYGRSLYSNGYDR